MKHMRIIDKHRPQIVVDGDKLLARLGVDRDGGEDASPGFQKVLDDTRYVSRNVRHLFARSVLRIQGGRFQIGSPLILRSRTSLRLDGATFVVSRP